jgi:hypothetical protein
VGVVTNEPICVCGHAKEQHLSHPGDTYCLPCNCKTFRPVLPWPDEVGLWWCPIGIVRAFVAAIRSGKVASWSIYYDGLMYQEDDWSDLPASFTKLLEPNPFEAKK